MPGPPTDVRARRVPALVSVVIPVHDASDTIRAQLDALSGQTYDGPFEVVVVDNGSTDGTADLVRDFAREHPAFRVVPAPDRQGSSYARNTGVRDARGDLLCFCESDDLVEPDWLAALVTAAATHDVVGGRLEVTKINSPLAIAWRAWTPPDDHLPSAMGLTVAVGANVCVWRDVLDDAGGWNEAVDVQTDRELSWRLQLAGHEIGYAPDAVVQYRYRHDLRGAMRQAYRYGRSDASLVRLFDAQIERPNVKQGLLGWAWLGWHLPDLVRSAEARGRWLNRLAWRAGRLVGSVRAGTLVI